MRTEWLRMGSEPFRMGSEPARSVQNDFRRIQSHPLDPFGDLSACSGSLQRGPEPLTASGTSPNTFRVIPDALGEAPDASGGILDAFRMLLRVKTGGAKPPLDKDLPPGLLGGGLGIHVGLGGPAARDARTGIDAELDELLAREPEGRPQVGRDARPEVLTLPLHLLAQTGQLPDLGPRALLPAIQPPRPPHHALELVVQILQMRHLRQVRLDVGHEDLPTRRLAGE
jgi:hypothetical protein